MRIKTLGGILGIASAVLLAGNYFLNRIKPEPRVNFRYLGRVSKCYYDDNKDGNCDRVIIEDGNGVRTRYGGKEFWNHVISDKRLIELNENGKN
ncbi:MAG: hypothetical protein KKB21_02935 [Nanoarchaeota archaeon]|nr:hypothetical protein [Nanoarchaeota archaeon]MBU4086507.1 hypothetical protein [Nanoarchaeota archaeon]